MSVELANEWDLAMRAGNFERAWQASDRIRAAGGADVHRFWQGEPFAGKHVMLRCLHGYGDSVQFLRFVPRLQQIAGSLHIEVAPAFVGLARCFAGVTDVITWGADAPASPPAWEVQMEVTELPHVLRTQLTDLPVAVRYLHLPARPEAPRERLLQVGLVWTSGEWNPSRSVDFTSLQALLRVSHCRFWNLQTCTAPLGANLHEDEKCRQSIVGLATRIAQLDLVITVDTLAAHLAGALGTPVWVLLQRVADWRWMERREDSPWYPSMRLFRQTQAGNWDGVIGRIALALEDMSQSRRRGDL